MSQDKAVDDTSYVILDALSEPRWKSNIQQSIADNDDVLDGTPSAQTVGRRVDEMCDAGLLSSCILSPDDTERDLIIGYKRTAQGDDAMGEKRSTMLEEVAHTTANIACGQQRTMSCAALTKLIADEFDLDMVGKTRIDEEYGEEELLSLLTLHFAQENADEHATHSRYHTADSDTAKSFRHLIEQE